MLKSWRRQPPVLGLRPYIWAILAIEYTGVALLLFGAAGTVRWTAGWAFVALFAITNTAFAIRLEAVDPALVSERVNVFAARGQPLWDRILFGLFFPLVYVWLIVAGLEIGRFGGAGFALPVQLAGALVMLVALWACYAVMHHNSYLAPTVRIQGHRQHKVVTTGPYAWVRHPFYAALIPFFFGGALLLGSRWAFVPAVLLGLLFAFRCTREEQHLAANLEGYEAYRKKVAWRLIPYIW